MSAPLSLRAAQPTDAGKLGAILCAFQDRTPWMPRLYSGAECIGFCGDMIDRGWVRVALQGGQVAGFLARDGGRIHALYLEDTARGRGIGALLIRDAKAAAPSLDLFVAEANTQARRFYGRAGFAETARSDGAGTEENLPDIHLVWRAARKGAA